MHTDPLTDAAAVLAAVAEKFSGGATSLGQGLELADGRLLAPVAESVVEAHSGTVSHGVHPDDLEAVNLIADTFEEGGDRVSPSDLAENGKTLGELAAAFATRARPVDPELDLEVVLDFIQETYSSGDGSFHGDDVLPDGRVLKDLVWGIEALTADAPRSPGLDVVSCMAETFGGGFDMARAEDFVDDDTTIGDVLGARTRAGNVPSP